jgi:hypothetical protein
MRTLKAPIDDLMAMKKKEKKTEKKKRIDGYATEDGYFFQAPPTGTFANYPKFYKAYLIIKIGE